MDSCALVMPLCFVGRPNWRVIQWISAHRTDFVVYGLRWFALSLLFAAFWIAWMYFFGHDRDHKAEMDEEYRELNKRKDDDEK